MAVKVATGSFAGNTSGADQTFTLGFQPKACIVWGTKLTAVGYGVGLGFFYGVTDFSGSGAWCFNVISTNLAATSDSARDYSLTNPILIPSTAATPGSDDAVGSIAAELNGITFGWSDAPGSAWLINYMAIGGDVVAKAGSLLTPAAVGSVAYTGIGFQPGALITAINAAGAGQTNANLGIGMAAGGGQGVVMIRDRDGQATMDTASAELTTRCLGALSSTAASLVFEATHTAFGADGFTLNWNTTAASGFDWGYLALGSSGGTGLSAKVGAETQRTSVGTKQTTGLTFIPSGVHALSVNRAASAAVDATVMKLSVGASDFVTDRGTWVQSADNVADGDVDSAQANSFLRMATQPSTTNAEATLSARDSTSFTANWATADATAREFLYLALGPYDTSQSVSPAGLAVPRTFGVPSVVGGTPSGGGGSYEATGGFEEESLTGTSDAAILQGVWNGRQKSQTYSLTVDPAYADGSAAGLRVEVRNGDNPIGFGDRAEVQAPSVETEGMVRWYAWSTKLDSTWPTFPSDGSIFQVTSQFHALADGPPPISFNLQGDFHTIQINYSVDGVTTYAMIPWRAAISRGTWRRFRIKVTWSEFDATGKLEFWLDGVKQTFNYPFGNFSGSPAGTPGNGTQVLPVRTLRPSDVVYFKQGLYQTTGSIPGAAGTPAIIYHDNFRRSTTDPGDTPPSGGGEWTAVPSGLVVPVGLGAPSVTTAALQVSPGGLAVPRTFGAPAVTPGPVTVSPAGLAVPRTFGAPTVTPGPVTTSPAGLAVPAAPGTPTITTGAITATPSGLAVPVGLGAAAATPGAVTVSPAGVAVPRTFGVPGITTGPVTVTATGLAVPSSIGVPSVTPGTVTVTPAGLAVPVTLGGAPTMTGNLTTVSATGIVVPVAFGAPTTSVGAITTTPAGLSVPVAFGAATISSTVSPTGLAVPRTFGVPTVTAGDASVTLGSGIVVPATFGAPTVTPGAVSIVTRVVEPFAYPDGNLPGQGGWVASGWGDGAAQVASGQVATGAAAGSWRGADLPGPYGYGAVTFTLAKAPTTNDVEVYHLMSLAGGVSTAAVIVSPAQVRLGRYLTNTFTTLATAATAPADGDVFRLETDATQARLYRNGTLILSGAHGLGYSSGRVGFDTNDAVARLDDVVVVESNRLTVPTTFGAPSVVPEQAVAPAGVAVPRTFGTPTVTQGAVSVNPGGLAVPRTFGAPTITPGAIAANPTGVAVPVGIGQPSALSTADTVSPPAAAVAASFGDPVAVAERSIYVGQDRRLQESVLLRSLNGYWVEVGKGVARGITVEGLQVSVDDQGPESCSFTLRRDPSHPWPELGAFNECITSLGGMPVYSGRVREAPGSSGASDTISVQGGGWRDHGDDDLVCIGFVHQRLSDWQDVRTTPDSTPQWVAPPVVNMDAGRIVIGYPNGTAWESLKGVGVRLDMGPNHPKARRVVAEMFATNPNAFATVYIRAHDEPDALGIPAGQYADLAVLGHASLSADQTAPTVLSGSTATGYRYITILLWTEAGGPGTTALDHLVTLSRILVTADPAYEAGGDSDLVASDVVSRMVANGSMPNLSRSTDLIDATAFPIPHYWPDSFSSPRSVMEAVNAYHDWQLGVDVDRRVFFRDKPSVPVLECGDWAGADFADASASSGEDVYNKVVVEAQGPAGEPLQVVRYSADAAPELASVIEVPAVGNGGFETNTTGWSSALAGTTLARTTGTWSHYEGAAGLTVGTTNASLNCLVQTTLTGLSVGRLYSVRMAHNNEVGVSGTFSSYEWYAEVSDTNGRVANINRVGSVTGWSVDSVNFIATATSMTLKVGARLPKWNIPGGHTMFNLDAVKCYEVAVNAVDRHQFVRAARLPVDAVLTQAGAEQIGLVWLRNHVFTPLKGSLSVDSHGGVRMARGGAPVHPGHLLLYYGQAIRLSNLEDPDTGGWGRVGRIASVSYDHDRGSATVELDNERHRMEALLARLAALTGQVG